MLECMVCASVREMIHSLKVLGYLPVVTQEPYNNSHLHDNSPNAIIIHV